MSSHFMMRLVFIFGWLQKPMERRVHRVQRKAHLRPNPTRVGLKWGRTSEAQIGNLLYRRMAFGRASNNLGAPLPSMIRTHHPKIKVVQPAPGKTVTA